METLTEQVETLTKLFAALEIPTEIENEAPESSNTKNEEADVIYDFSSDDENPYSNPYTNFGIKRNKSYVENDLQSQYIYGPPSLEENYLYQQGMVKNKQNKWEKVPPQYIPKLFTTPLETDILDINCDTNTENKIQEWSNKMGIQIQLTEELRTMQPRDFLNYIIHKTTGNVYRYLSSLDEDEKAHIATTDAIETFKRVLGRIIKEFLGKNIDDKDSREAFQNESLWHITNLRICNMYYLESFICEFSEHYYNLTEIAKKTAIDMFFQKLPLSVSQDVTESFKKSIESSSITNTLGGRINLLRAWMKRACNKQITKKEAKVKLYCDNISNRIGQYGCKTNKQKPRKKIWKKQSYKPKYKQTYKQGNRKYFRDRKQYKKKYYSKDKYCPNKKQNCKCWLCHEEGHKANNCPNKNKKEKETNLLKIAYDYGYEPIEDSDVDSDIDIYAYTTDSESTDNE